MTSLEGVLAPIVDANGGGPAGWVDRLARYEELLRARNEQVNLVSRRSIDRLVEAQLLPSLAALLVVPAGEALRVLDVGTGGGLPGIPLKILRPSVRLDLIDATRKKVAFVDEAVRELGLEDTRVHWGRIEEPPEDLVARAPFDLVLARAVGSEPRLLRAVRALSPDSPLWVFDAPEQGEKVLRHPTLGDITSLRRA